MYPIGATLEVDYLFYKHVSSFVGNNLVLHNHRIRGEEIVSLDTFSEGRKIKVKKGGVSDVATFMRRVQNVLANPKSYKVFSNNCEHTVSRVRDGITSSPQLTGYILLCVGALILSRSMRD